MTTKRLLLVELKQLTNKLGWATRKEIDDLMTAFKEAESSFQYFKSKVKKNITECDLIAKLLDEIVDQFETCREAYQAAMHRLFRGSDENDKLPKVEPENSVSQVSERVSKISTASSKMLARKIEIDRKRVELKAIRERDRAMAEADAAAAAAAAAKGKADADAKFLVEELEAEEKYISLSERGLSVASSRRAKCFLVSKCHNTETLKLSEVVWRDSDRDARKSLDGEFVSSRTNRTSCRMRFAKTKPKVVLPSQTAFPVSGASLQHAKLDTYTADNSKVFEAYFERQGRNEFINLAAQIGYDGNNIAYVFYENQVRKLMAESPCDERKLEILRASCLDQPREMVNLFIAPMRCSSTPQRIEKALDRLRQRYGVSGGLTSEPQIISIRH